MVTPMQLIGVVNLYNRIRDMLHKCISCQVEFVIQLDLGPTYML